MNTLTKYRVKYNEFYIQKNIKCDKIFGYKIRFTAKHVKRHEMTILVLNILRE